ncbi:heme/hemin ABC transporter substrate-binding protein [Agaribacter marinus]|uniref:Hemin ABC transporter substrate-binding protein n=1 Tax=Agaribacter marinus TaxID=1431249 RepID=A0AA37T0L9_9ALTE|nr:ABC transporter substrate-binding protein [Agaribacter marinus]GLR71679.1 hemin ABC transporter substrate-binding protein [Agaribacter marinus]
MDRVTTSILVKFVLMFVFLSTMNKDVHSQEKNANFSVQLAGDNTPLKIVSAGGSVTEILFALGAAASVIAVDTSSSYPASVQTLPNVGYYRQLSVEGVISTGASHLIALKGAGPSTGLQQIAAAGVAVHGVDVPKNIEGLYQAITTIGELVEKQEEARALIASLTQQFATIRAHEWSIVGKTAAFMMSISDQGLMAAGQSTVPDLIFSQLGLTNPYTDINGFKAVSPESLLKHPPDFILMPAHQARGHTVEQLCQKAAMRLYVKQHGCNLYIVDSLKFLGLTPRLPSAFKDVLAYANN